MADLVGSLTDAEYGGKGGEPAGTTVGWHVRHCLDHFVAALGAASSPEDPVDYQNGRGCAGEGAPMEVCREAAIRAIRGVRMRLGTLDAGSLGEPVVVRIGVAAGGRACEPARVELGSTVGRELAFAVCHAAHHLERVRELVRGER